LTEKQRACRGGKKGKELLTVGMAEENFRRTVESTLDVREEHMTQGRRSEIKLTEKRRACRSGRMGEELLRGVTHRRDGRGELPGNGRIGSGCRRRTI